MASEPAETEANAIVPGLFLGSRLAAEDVQAMRKRNISHVLICHPDIPELHPESFKYGRVPVADVPTANLLELLPRALEFMSRARRAGKGVFVHCQKGISRSSSCVIALLMLERGISFEESFHEVRRKRPSIYPNVGFQRQLQHFQQLLSKVTGSPDEKLQSLRALVPRGNLESPESPFQIGEAISESMGISLDALETTINGCLKQPESTPQVSLWKEHGIYFENIYLYKALPSDENLLQRTRMVSEKLTKLARSCPEQSCKGVRHVVAMAKVMDSWTAFAGPLLGQGKMLLGGEYDSDSDNEVLGQAVQEKQVGNSGAERRSRSRSPRIDGKT